MKSSKVEWIMFHVKDLPKSTLKTLIVAIMSMNAVTAKFFVQAMRKIHTKETLANLLNVMSKLNQEEL